MLLPTVVSPTPPISLLEAIAVLVSTTLVYLLGCAVYNIYFHPLASIPGPRLAAATQIWYAIWSLRGTLWHHAIHDLHTRYGDVVRVGPNTVSFASSASYKDIYGFRPGTPTFLKSTIYDSMSTNPDQKRSLITERDVVTHSRARKLLSHGFSSKALLEQEDLVRSYVDMLVEKVATHGGKGMEMVEWFQLFTFDVIGKLSFGRDFGCLKAEKEHPWISFVFHHLFTAVVLDVLGHWPWLLKTLRYILPASMRNAAKQHREYASNITMRRIQSESKEVDFMTRILEQRSAHEISDEELAAHATGFVLAGSETTASFLSAVTYWLAKNPSAYAKLAQEIRTTFSSASAITAEGLAHLPYLQAVIEEGLRICPPVSTGLPRISPGATVAGVFIPADAEVFTATWSVSHNPEYFPDPYAFVPERWLAPNDLKKMRDASQVFSLGPRSCIGRNLAWMEMRLVLATIIYNFDFELMDGELDYLQSLKYYVTWLKPELYVRFSPVKK